MKDLTKELEEKLDNGLTLSGFSVNAIVFFWAYWHSDNDLLKLWSTAALVFYSFYFLFDRNPKSTYIDAISGISLLLYIMYVLRAMFS